MGRLCLIAYDPRIHGGLLLMRKKLFFSILIACFVCFAGGTTAAADKKQGLRIAVASNFIRPMEALIALFEGQSTLKVKTIFSSTGKLYAQIINAAPYDIFLAADSRRPQLLFEQGKGEKPFVYAKGRMVLWSYRPELAAVGSWQEAVTNPSIKKIALAKPELAPYGLAAKIALKRAGLFSGLRDKFVYGQNVAQAFQFSQQRATDVSFTAFSFAMSTVDGKGRFWPIPEAALVVQQGCILKHSVNPAAAARFTAFLQSNDARAVIERYGYE